MLLSVFYQQKAPRRFLNVMSGLGSLDLSPDAGGAIISFLKGHPSMVSPCHFVILSSYQLEYFDASYQCFDPIVELASLFIPDRLLTIACSSKSSHRSVR